MKKLGKKIISQQETIEAYCSSCSYCGCNSCPGCSSGIFTDSVARMADAIAYQSSNSTQTYNGSYASLG